MRQAGGRVLASCVGQKRRRRAVGVEPIQLLLLITPGVARIDERVGRLGPVQAETHRLGEIGKLPRFVAGFGDAMQLRDVAGASRDDQLAFFRMPAYCRCRLEFRIRRDLHHQRRRNRRNVFGLEVCVGNDDVGGARSGCDDQHREQHCAKTNGIHGKRASAATGKIIGL